MIDDMAVYIANLGKYNEGYLVGAWFTFPIDEEDVKEKIGLNEQYQEQSIELTRNEFRILYYFFMNEDKVISKEELLEKLWNDKYYIDENVLLVNMTRLKKKMKEIGIVHLLENIRGKGWKL